MHFVAAATTTDASAAGNDETAVTDCQAAIDGLCLDNDDGMRLTSHTFS